MVVPQLAEVAQLVGDPGRANILATLMDGRTLTAKELATVAGVTAQTASSHLAKLVEHELLTVEKRGPRQFYRLATPLVARMLEGIMNVAVTGPPRFRPPSRIDSAMRRADKHGFSDALRNGGITEGSAPWKNAWAAYYAYQSRR